MGYEASSNWYATILDDSEGNEEEALVRFLDLLGQFSREVLETTVK